MGLLRKPPFPAAPVGFRRSGSRKCAFSGRNRRRFSPRRAGPANSGHASPLSRQVRLGNHQVREAQKRRKPLPVPLQTPIANQVAAEHPLADPAVPGVTPDLLLLAVQKPTRRRQVATLAAVPSSWCTRPRVSVPMCSFIPKCHWFPFLVRCISGSRALLSFPVDDGAEMMVASTMLPFFSKTPRSAR